MNGLLTIDSVQPVLALLRKLKLRIDPQYRGECMRLSENAGIRLNYFRADGLTLDAACEAIADRGYTWRRATPNELMELLESAFVMAPNATVTVTRVNETAIAREDERQHAVRRSTRLRLYECSSCGKKIRCSDDYLLADHLAIDDAGERVACGTFIRKTPLLNSLPF